MSGTRTARLQELAEHPQHGRCLRQWYCEPPPAGVPYQVAAEEWIPAAHGAGPFWNIREIKDERLADG